MLLEVNGIESINLPLLYPPTSIPGGGERDRTDDLLRAKQALSQLSYTPQKTLGFTFGNQREPIAYGECPEALLVGLVGVEPTTSRLSGVRSNRD